MDLLQLTLDEFLCIDDLEMTSDVPLAFENSVDALPPIGSKIKNLGPYALHYFSNQSGNVALLLDCVPVGFYWGDVLAIDGGHRGKGLSVPMILEAIKERPPPKKRILSCAGRHALAKAWSVANGHAVDSWR